MRGHDNITFLRLRQSATGRCPKLRSEGEDFPTHPHPPQRPQKPPDPPISPQSGPSRPIGRRPSPGITINDSEMSAVKIHASVPNATKISLVFLLFIPSRKTSHGVWFRGGGCVGLQRNDGEIPTPVRSPRKCNFMHEENAPTLNLIRPV